MFEKVNPNHPDKVADRIAGALVDYAYTKESDPKIAVEVLLGHKRCLIIAETSVHIPYSVVCETIERLSGITDTEYKEVPQDIHLANNQDGKIRCGDNGIFKGVPVTAEQQTLTKIAKCLYEKYKCDGKYIIDGDKIVICQSNAKTEDIKALFPKAIVNPIGDWTGGTDVDSGATNRKLGSDMADSVTGGGLHGKDLSKADVSVNIYCFLKAQETGKEVKISCAIGDDTIDEKPYRQIVEIARSFIKEIGGFEKFAEWGLVI